MRLCEQLYILYDKQHRLIVQQKDIDKEIDRLEKEAKQLIKKKLRKASIILSYRNKSIILSKHTNSYGERHVYWYNGKKGELALSNTRASLPELRLWLFNIVESTKGNK